MRTRLIALVGVLFMVAASALAGMSVSGAAVDPGVDSGADSGDVAAATVYDFGLAHDFSGFGANVWITNQRIAQRRAAMTGLDLAWVRSAGPRPSIPPEDLGSGGQTVAELLAIFRANQQLPRSVVDGLVSDLNATNAQMHQIVFRMPDPWATVIANCGPPTCYQATTARIGDYVNYIVAEVLYAREYGMPVRMVELTNEPEGTWNGRWTLAQYVELVQRARVALNANGLAAIGIQGPGTGTQRSAIPFLDALVATGAVNDLAAISVHDYDTSFTDDCGVRLCLEPPIGVSDEFRAAWTRLGLDLPLNITEYTNRDRATWNAPQYDCSDGAGTGRTNGVCALNTPEYGLWLATEGLKLAADGATSAQLWELQDVAFNPVNWGLINVDGDFRPAYEAFRAFQPQVGSATNPASGTGARAVRGSTSTKQTVTAAFDVGGDVVVVVSNLTSGTVTVMPTFNGIAQPLTGVENQKIYQALTGQTSPANVVDQPGGAWRITVPGQSLVAVTFTPSGTPTAFRTERSSE